ncbi:MAG: aspartate/glutamate racemase family protein [Proteobacteria bacterium]|nr:aspartate/glutamate racemase family protein [Pseudomonadota bacterium]MBU1583662.1 aspartate/glutamate racemase family protein [Pseudomonadota bacterium]MBU2454387.1 aspartate/glutamate racemase family protein [Pseudomonadota bacterium]MBU2628064.1 aspartate/glutamate racemase family protein [Pseudomonadota bacterium]
MQYQNRDAGINHMVTRKAHTCYGMGIGIMILDDIYPGFPGDVRNASAFPYPIQYEIVDGIDIKQLLWHEDKSPCLDPILTAAKKLEKMGCRAIAAECGYFAFFQPAVAACVDVPVFMSSLLQVPFIQQTIGSKKDVGIVCYQKQFLTDTHLANVGIRPGSNYLIAGASDEYNCTELDRLWNWEVRPDKPEAVYEIQEKQMVDTCVAFCKNHPTIGAIMLECTGMQPFARAIQHRIDLPVFSWGTLLDYAYSVVVHRDYYGHI